MSNVDIRQSFTVSGRATQPETERLVVKIELPDIRPGAGVVLQCGGAIGLELYVGKGGRWVQ